MIDPGYSTRHRAMLELARTVYARAHDVLATDVDPTTQPEIYDIAGLLAATCNLRDRVVHTASRRQGLRVSRQHYDGRDGSWVLWDTSSSGRPTWHPDHVLEDQP